MDYNKTFVYDERPSFESYNAVNFPYPGNMMPIFPNQIPNNMQNPANNCSGMQNKINSLESKIDNLENRIQKLEGNMYPKAMDFSKTSDYLSSSYQNSMNIM